MRAESRRSAGTVTAGSRADLVLLRANPLTDIANVGRIAGVVVRGQWYPRGQIDSMRAAQVAGFAN